MHGRPDMGAKDLESFRAAATETAEGKNPLEQAKVPSIVHILKTRWAGGLMARSGKEKKRNANKNYIGKTSE